MKAQFIGVGVGPGDPELITLKALRYIQNADVISYLQSDQGYSQSKTIADQALSSASKQQLHIPVVISMGYDRGAANKVYDTAAHKIQNAIDDGKVVVFLCEGDPLFFGSFAYLLARLQVNNQCQVVPGISSVHAASSALRQPLTVLQESFAVVSGRHTLEQILSALKNHDTVVIMKAGRSRQKVLSALTASNRARDTTYLEYIGREKEYIERDISVLQDGAGPYFSLFVVSRHNREIA